MVGEDVVLLSPVQAGEDVMGNLVVEYVESTVSNVLAAPSSTSNDVDATRPDGVTATLTLQFPKTFDGDLRGCFVEYRGNRYAIQGAPIHWPGNLCPTDWWITAEAVMVDG